MFETLNQHAEEFATRLPRRAFFGKLARAALPVAAGLSGFLVLPGESWALGRRRQAPKCCFTVEGDIQVCQGATSKECCPPGTYWNHCSGNRKQLPLCPQC
jgi:hypothetical protein